MRKKSSKRPNQFYATFALVVLLFLSSLYVLANLVGPSPYDDDPIYLMLANQFSHSLFHQTGYIYTARLMQIIPIGILFKLFGVSVLTSVLWDIISYLGIIAVAFYFTKELYNQKAGLVGAVLCSIFPLLFKNAPSATEGIPMAFVISLAMLGLLLGYKRQSRGWYLVCGFLLPISFLVTPESFIAILFVAIACAFLAIKRKAKNLQYLIVGALVALLITFALNYLYSGNALFSFSINNAYYSDPNIKNVLVSASQGLMYYPNVMFPYNNGVVPNQVGPYFYALFAAIIYLVLRKEKSAYLAIAWALFSILYLEFGPMHISLFPSFSYVMLYGVARFLLIATVPMVAILSIALVKLLEKEKLNALSKSFLFSFLFAMIALPSLVTNIYWHSVGYLSSYDQIAISSYLNLLPNSTVVYLPSELSNIYSYMHYSNLSRFINYMPGINCTQLKSGGYLVSGALNQSAPGSLYYYLSSCPNLSQVQLPHASNSVPYYYQIEQNIVQLNLYRIS